MKKVFLFVLVTGFMFACSSGGETVKDEVKGQEQAAADGVDEPKGDTSADSTLSGLAGADSTEAGPAGTDSTVAGPTGADGND